VAFSGGKDSVVIKHICDLALVKYDAHYNVIGIDPPPVVKFIRDHHKDVIFDYVKDPPFLRELERRGFPMRRNRWCCQVYKEAGGSFRTVVTGVRWAESKKRKNSRRMVEHCMQDKSKYYVNPIIDWTNDQVWKFIYKHSLPYCSMYNYGYKRLGCVFCPQKSFRQRMQDVEIFPKYAASFLKAFCNLHARLVAKGSSSVDRWASGEDMFWWWLSGEEKYIIREE